MSVLPVSQPLAMSPPQMLASAAFSSAWKGCGVELAGECDHPLLVEGPAAQLDDLALLDVIPVAHESSPPRGLGPRLRSPGSRILHARRRDADRMPPCTAGWRGTGTPWRLAASWLFSSGSSR